MTVHIDYCDATSTTGKVLQEKLGLLKYELGNVITGDTVIGWGSKRRRMDRLDGVTYLNHPADIEKNRDKMQAMELMVTERVAIPSWTVDGMDAERMLPCIGRTRRHQGGSGFWFCNSKLDVQYASAAGADYFVRAQRIASEFRAHVFDGEMIRLCKKVPHENPRRAWVRHMMDKLFPDGWESERDSSGVLHEEHAVTYRGLQEAARHITLPDRTLRSNHRGWKFVECGDRIEHYDSIWRTSVKAVKAVGLQFGAVDLATVEYTMPPLAGPSFESEKVVVFEVNSAPGLEGSTLDTWVSAFTNALEQGPELGELSQAQLRRLHARIGNMLSE